MRQKAQFERLLQHGIRRSKAGYTFFVERRETGAARLGILITRRHARLATQRNRIKRCIREAFRLEQNNLQSIDLLVRPPQGVKPGAAMIDQLRALLNEVSSS